MEYEERIKRIRLKLEKLISQNGSVAVRFAIKELMDEDIL